MECNYTKIICPACTLSFRLNFISVRRVGFVDMMHYDAFFWFWVSGGQEVDHYVAAGGRLPGFAMPGCVPASYRQDWGHTKGNEERTSLVHTQLSICSAS
jgi:hypothetical protein